MPKIPNYTNDSKLVDLENMIFSIFQLNITKEVDRETLHVLCQCVYLSGYVAGQDNVINKLQVPEEYTFVKS